MHRMLGSGEMLGEDKESKPVKRKNVLLGLNGGPSAPDESVCGHAIYQRRQQYCTGTAMTILLCCVVGLG